MQTNVYRAVTAASLLRLALTITAHHCTIPAPMIGNAFVTVLCLAITLLAAWAGHRAWRSANAFAKWLGAPLCVLATAIALAVTAFSSRGLMLLYAPHGRPVHAITATATPDRLARGEHIAGAWCATCHSATKTLPLTGGTNLAIQAGMPLGDLTPFNLTPAGPLKDWSDGEIFRAVRDGADRTGHRLAVMSSQHVRFLSDEDIISVIAFLRSQPAVGQSTPPERFTFLTTILAGAGMLPFLPGYGPDTFTAPARGPSVEYGRYVVNWVGCAECHGPALTGGGGGVVPKGPNLRVVKGWTSDQFLTTIRTGKTPYGKQLDSTLMPWKTVQKLDDDELRAVHAYLTSLPDQAQPTKK